MRLLLAIAHEQQHRGGYDLSIPLDEEIDFDDILDQVKDFLFLAIEEMEGRDDTADIITSVSRSQDTAE